MSETDLQRAILGALERVYPTSVWWRANAGVVRRSGRTIRLAPEGTPDIMGVLAPDGRSVAIEIKMPRGVVGPAQVRRLGELAAAGALVGVARSVDGALAIVAGGAP